MRVAIVYDCIYPYSVGGAERWYVHVAQRLAERHEVTYLTSRQWPPAEPPTEAFTVRAVAPGADLYTASGRRRIWPPVRFGIGLFWHLLLRGGRYDVVHGASFPYFSVIGAWLALLVHPHTRLLVDWHEVWTRQYWKSYLGPAGAIGYAVQAFCTRLPDCSFSFSRMHADRLPGRVVRLTGEFVEGERPVEAAVAETSPLVVFAGRHIPEKNVVALPAALVWARRELPKMRARIFGDGPDHAKLSELIGREHAEGFIAAPGFVDFVEVRDAIERAACLVLPSIREGYGLVVVEALSAGTPVVVVAGPDNAATELIEDGVNGFVAASASAEDLGAAIVRAVTGGNELRRSAWDWYERHRGELSIDDSLVKIEAVYAESPGR